MCVYIHMYYVNGHAYACVHVHGNDVINVVSYVYCMHIYVRIWMCTRVHHFT